LKCGQLHRLTLFCFSVPLVVVTMHAVGRLSRFCALKRTVATSWVSIRHASTTGIDQKNTIPSHNTAPVSRKDKGDDKNDKPGYDFDKEVDKILRKVYEEVMIMREKNKGMEVEFHPNEGCLNIFTDKGRLNLFKEPKRPILVYQSFNSGSLNYEFHPKEGHWLATQDDHDLRGIVLRDLIKHNVGLPNLE
jgi:frataxin-like iron-binding protein CyaY